MSHFEKQGTSSVRFALMLLLCLVAAAAFTSCGGWGGSFGYDGGTDLDAGTGTDTDADSGADTNGANFYRLP